MKPPGSPGALAASTALFVSACAVASVYVSSDPEDGGDTAKLASRNAQNNADAVSVIEALVIFSIQSSFVATFNRDLSAAKDVGIALSGIMLAVAVRLVRVLVEDQVLAIGTQLGAVLFVSAVTALLASRPAPGSSGGDDDVSAAAAAAARRGRRPLMFTFT